MKTITIDFDMYKQELREARQAAVKDTPRLVELMNQALRVIEPGRSTYEELGKAVRSLYEVREKLKGVNLDE